MMPQLPDFAGDSPPPVPTLTSVPDSATDRADLARRGWLTMVIARQAQARCTAVIEEWRLLLAMRRTGRSHRRGSWRRLAHAAACLLLVFGGIVRGLALPWPVEAATIPFTPHSIVDGAFDGALSLSYADLDGDGDVDVLGAAVNADNITWWESDGTPADGGWTTHTIITNFNGAASVVSTDLDGDGDLDVLGAARDADDIAWWRNDGTPADGGWTTHTIITNFNGVASVAAADLDDDGDLDVLGAANTAHDITWWKSDGTPADGGWITHTISGTFLFAASVASADLDSDGDLDVLGAARDDNAITWWENDGMSPPGWTTHTIDSAFGGAFSVAAADLDGDGDLDVLGAGRNADDISWWENDGMSPPGWITHTIASAFPGAVSAAAADLDGDGDLDVLGAARDADDITWWESDGTPADGGWLTHTIDAAFDATQSVAADLDGDGDLDVLGTAFDTDDITWWENRTIHKNALLGGTIPYTHTVDGGFDGAINVTANDLDTDGDLDLVGAAIDAGEIAWWESDGTPANGGWTTHTIDVGFTYAESVAVADLDKDGDLDVLGAAASADDITWWENDGTPADGGWTTHTIQADFDAANWVSSADLDRDGDVDVLGAARFDDDITWWENDGTPVDGGWMTHTIQTDIDGAYTVATADLDRDGDLDVLGAGRYANTISWWQNDGSPANGGWITHTIDGSFSYAVLVNHGDLDSDGDIDVIGAANLADEITWWENDGSPTNGGWTTHTIVGGFDGAQFVTVADLDGDGDVDVLGAATDADDITWWENDGSPANGGWTTQTIDADFDHAFNAAPVDLDSDGDLDVVGAGVNTNDITWWQNKGGQFTLPTTGTAPATLNAGQSDDFLTIVFTHNGRTGDNDAELVTLHLRFEDTTGAPDPLTTAEANAIIQDLKVYVDANANGMYDPGTDTLVTTVGTLALSGSGDQIVTFTDADANVQLPFATGTRTYFAVLDLTTTYPTDPARNGVTTIRMTHITEASSTAEDRVNDLPLGMAHTANTQSSAGGTLLQSPLAVTINLFTAEASGSGGPTGPAGWLLRFGVLGAAVAGVGAAWRRRLT